jgi:PKD repeat protein
MGLLHRGKPLLRMLIFAGLYNPRLIVKDVNGCPASTQLSDSIVIDSLHIAIKGIPPLVCDSALIQFNPDVESFAATNLGTPLLYKWNFGTGMAGDTSNTRNPSFRYNLRTYTVRFSVRSPYGCIKETSATMWSIKKRLAP